MTEKDRQIAVALKKRLSQVVKLVDLKVFGSRARGDADADEFSDLDISIVVEQLDPNLKHKVREAVWEISLEHGLYISALIFTRHEIEESPVRISPIVRNIYEEGVSV